MKTIAIVGGYGKMGQWLAGFLKKESFKVIITGPNADKLAKAGHEMGVSTASNDEAVRRSEAVIISVPIDNVAKVVQEIAPLIRPGQVVIDITSVKTAPVAAMHRYIQKGTVLGIHPLFGPGAKGVANLNFVLTPTNAGEAALAAKIEGYLTDREARVTVMTPEEHDEAMAVILGLSHFIAMVAADTLSHFKRFSQVEAISGVTFKVLLTLIESVVSEDPGLYAALQMALPHLPELEKSFQQNAALWAGLVELKERDKFIARMNDIKSFFQANSPNFGKAYENMYRMAEGLK